MVVPPPMDSAAGRPTTAAMRDGEDENDATTMAEGPLTARGGAAGRPSARRRRRRRRSSASAATAASLFLALPASHAGSDHDALRQRTLDPDAGRQRRLGRGLVDVSKTTRSIHCLSGHSLSFSLYTDAHSIEDNGWEFNYAPAEYDIDTLGNGPYLADGDVGGGKFGYGAVVQQEICADGSNEYIDASSSWVESCYDLHLHDGGGDGLTAPHAAHAGLAGGFSLRVDGNIAVEHRGQACLSDDWDEWNACALEGGFEYCGVRVCATSTEGSGGVLGGTTVSTLGGSQCRLRQPECDPANDAGQSQSSIRVDVETDAFAREFSYEVRASSRKDSIRMKDAAANPLLLAGGRPVHDEGDASNPALLGQMGVGPDLDDNASHFSSACLPDSILESDACYDLRAYDAYGDGLGCGADGLLSLTLSTTEGYLSLAQVDENMARRQELPTGEKTLACMDRERLSKWSYCAIRLCSDGTVMGLEGNQCDFGHGEELLDGRYAGVDPLAGEQMRPNNGGEEDEDWVAVLETEEGADVDIVEWYEGQDEDKDLLYYDGSWAEYYEQLQPGFADDPEALRNEYNAPTAEPGRAKPPRPGKQGQKGQKGPKKEAYETKMALRQEKLEAKKARLEAKTAAANERDDRPRPQSQQVVTQGDVEERVALRPFEIDLLDVKFPAKLRYTGPAAISRKVQEHLVSYLADYAKTHEDDVPLAFDVDCSRTRRRVGQELRWVLECTGDALLDGSSSRQQKRAVNAVVQDAFAGKAREGFLEVMYNYHQEMKMQGAKQEASGAMTGRTAAERRKEMKKRRERLQARKQARQRTGPK